MPAIAGKSQGYFTAIEGDCCIEKLFSPYSEAQPISMALHLTIEQQQEVPQGPMSPKGTAPYQPIHSLFHLQDQQTPLTGFPPTGQLSFETTTSAQQADQPAISPSTFSPPQQRQHLPGTQEKGGRCDLTRWNYGSTEHYVYQKSHKFVVLVVVMVPSVGMACISTSSCIVDTLRNQTSVSYELLTSSQDDSTQMLKL